MENKREFRTDMASEAHRLWRAGERRLDALPGVEAEEWSADGLSFFRVRIRDGEGAAALKKPPGQYLTVEAERFFPRGDARFPAAAQALAARIREMLGFAPRSALVVGLGNAEVTPDALGPAAARAVFPTRHLKRSGNELFASLSEVAVSTPGVLGSSGVESAVQAAALCRELAPDCVLVVDALAGAEPERLCRTVQLTDAGIAPGSGVGNDRAALSRETLGAPVLALGVPTVIDAAAFGADEALRGLFVTPRDIDESVRAAGRLIGYAIDLALHPGLTVEDVAALIE